MEFTAASLNLMKKMNMIRMELMMKLRAREQKEQDLLSRLGNSDGNVDLDCSLKLGLSVDNPTQSAIIFYGASCIHPQVGNNQGLVTGASAFRPWGVSNSDHDARNYNNNINTGFIDFLGSTPVMASLRPPLPTIPILSAKLSGHILSLAPAAETIKMRPIRIKSFQRAESGDPDSDGSENGKCCEICKRANTPLWRNGPRGPKTLCNACGIRYMKVLKRALGITESFPRPRDSIKKPKPKF